jgi:hypothetical protein
MFNHRLALGAIVTLLAAMVAPAARAQQAISFGVSAAGFQPLTPSDAPYIVSAGYGIYNTDPSNSRYITAQPGAGPSPNVLGGPSDYRLIVYPYNNGGVLTCTFYVIELGGAYPTYSGTTSTTTTGTTQLQVDVFFTATPGAIYAPGIVCQLPPSNSQGNGTIFGVQ